MERFVDGGAHVSIVHFFLKIGKSFIRLRQKVEAQGVKEKGESLKYLLRKMGES